MLKVYDKLEESNVAGGYLLIVFNLSNDLWKKPDKGWKHLNAPFFETYAIPLENLYNLVSPVNKFSIAQGKHAFDRTHAEASNATRFCGILTFAI